MVLKKLKEELISSLHQECSGFEIYGQDIKQKFTRPCLVVQLKSGSVAWERGRSRITAVFQLHVFGEEESRQFDRLGQMAAAVQRLSAACTQMTFVHKEDRLEAEVTFVMRAQLQEEKGETMKKLREDMKIG